VLKSYVALLLLNRVSGMGLGTSCTSFGYAVEIYCSSPGRAEGLRTHADSITVELSKFWTLSIVLDLFKTKLNSIGLSYLTGNTLRLHYEPNRLTLYKGF
jgi:hypothetical protein